MKRVLVFLLFATFGANAQQLDEESSWVYKKEPLFMGDSYGEKDITISSIVNQGSYSEIDFNETRILFNPNVETGSQDTVFQKSTFAFKVVDSVVYYKTNRVWFDYRLQINETISFYRWINDAPDSLVNFKVDSIYLDENNLKNWRLSFVGDSISIGNGKEYGKVTFWNISFNEKMGFTHQKYEIEDWGHADFESESFIPFYYWTFRTDHYSQYGLTCYKNPKMDISSPTNCNAEFLSQKLRQLPAQLNAYIIANQLFVKTPKDEKALLQVFSLDGKIIHQAQLNKGDDLVTFDINENLVIVVYSNGHSVISKKIISIN
jgi:hypothetical protein